MKGIVAILLSSLVWIGCGLSAEPDPSTTLMVFDPSLPPVVNPHALPFPSDMYQDRAGAYRYQPVASQAPMYGAVALPALEQVAGFGTQQAVHFGYVGANPAAPAPMTGTGMWAGVVDLDTLQQVPVELQVDARLALVSVTPALGYPLQGGQRYLAFVRSDADVRPSAAFVSYLASAPETAYQQALQAAVADAGFVPDDLASATLYSTWDVLGDVLAIRSQILAADAAVPEFDPSWFGPDGRSMDILYGEASASYVGRDNPGGVLHAHVDSVFTGSFVLPQWIDFDAREGFRYRNGNPEIVESRRIPFVLTLPDCPEPSAGFPVVIIQHGLGGTKAFAVVIADAFAQQCIATVGIDAVAHGGRAMLVRDHGANFHAGKEPDQIADRFQLGGLDQIYLLKPLTARDNLRQSGLDNVQLAYSLASALWRPAARPGTGSLVDAENIYYLGESMGSIVGAVTLAMSPHIKAGIETVPGGNFMRLFAEGPGFHEFLWAAGLLTENDPTLVPRRDHPGLNLVQGVLDGADPINYAPLWQRHPPAGQKPKDILMLSAERDQLISASTTEGLATAGGIPFLDGYINWRQNFDIVPEAAPAQGNMSTADGVRTGGVVMFPEANHGLIQYRCATIYHERNDPWDRLPDAYAIANPTARVQEIAAHFVATAVQGAAEILPAGSAGSASLDPVDCD